MEIFEAIKNRRSIRQFTSPFVSEEFVGKLVETTRMTPTAGNAQAYPIVIVRQAEKK